MAVKWIKVMNLLISDFVIVTKELKKGDAYLKKWLRKIQMVELG